MKKVSNPTIVQETYEEQNKAGRYNPGLVLVYKNRRISLSAGRDDHVRVWVNDAVVYVMSVNYSLSYAGLESFDLEDGAPGWSEAESIFLQNEWDFSDNDGEDFFDWGDRKQFNYLCEMLSEMG